MSLIFECEDPHVSWEAYQNRPSEEKNKNNLFVKFEKQ